MNTTSVVTLLSRVSQVKPTSKDQAFSLYIHYLLQQIEDFVCTKVQETEISSATSPLPDSWNSCSSCYTFQYKKQSKEYDLRILPFAEFLLVVCVENGSNDTKQFQRNVHDYFPEDKSIDEVLQSTEAWKLIGEEFLEFLHGNEKKPVAKEGQTNDFPSLRDHSQPQARPHQEPAYPFAPQYPGHHPGMEVGPNNPIFGDDPLRIGRPQRPPFPGRNPPNARFDPFGPVPGANAGPNPDHMGFPPDSMFM